MPNIVSDIYLEEHNLLEPVEDNDNDNKFGINLQVTKFRLVCYFFITSLAKLTFQRNACKKSLKRWRKSRTLTASTARTSLWWLNLLQTQLGANKTKLAKEKSDPSLASIMRSKLLQYKQEPLKGKKPNYESRGRLQSGNNPLYAYPSTHSPFSYDPKYRKSNKNSVTRFATNTVVDGEKVNLLETVGKRMGAEFCRTSLPVPETLNGEVGRPAVLEVSRRDQGEQAAAESALVTVRVQVRELPPVVPAE